MSTVPSPVAPSAHPAKKIDGKAEVTRSAAVSSNQQSSHRQLANVVRRHQRFSYLRPLATFNRTQFDRIDRIVNAQSGPVILDSGCGNGEGTRALAGAFPDHLVIGIDKSGARIAQAEAGETLPNLYFVRGNCVDLWRLAMHAKWPIGHHFLLYPNPWPKAKHLQRRWHGHPVFGCLLTLGGCLELRSNWEIYVVEFAAALEIAGAGRATVERFFPCEPMTPFERKYAASGHALYRLKVQLD